MKERDNKLVERCLLNDQEAFALLYNHYKSYIHYLCLRYGIKVYDVKDQMQVIFSQAFMKIDSFDDNKGSFKTWLTRVGINQILMTKRKKKDNWVEWSEVQMPESMISMDNTYESNDALEHIKEKLRKMPSPYIEVFNMSIVEGYSHKEISEILNIPEGTSRTLLFRGRDWAKRSLNFINKNMQCIA